MENTELDVIKRLLDEHVHDIKESRVIQTELMIKTIKEEIDKRVNGKIDKIGEVTYDTALKLKKYIDRSTPMLETFEKSHIVGAYFFSKAKFWGSIAGSILAMYEVWLHILRNIFK